MNGQDAGQYPEQETASQMKIRTWLLKAALDRPRIKPGGRMAVITVVIIALALALAGLSGSSPPAQLPELPEDSNPAMFTENADEYLTDSEIESTLIVYLALTTWAEIVQRTAQETPANFSKVMLSQHSMKCAEEYRVRRLTEQTRNIEPNPAARSTLMNCSMQMALDQRTPRPEWPLLSPLEREAHSRARLRMLWTAISPEYQISTRIAFQHANKITKDNNDEFRSFVEEYQNCEDYVEEKAPELGLLKSEKQLGQKWLDIEAELRNCAEQNTVRLFPEIAGTQ